MNKFKLKKMNCSSIYQCIAPIFYISKIFGLAPFTLPSKNKTLKSSFLDFIIFLLSETICLYLLYYILDSKYIFSPPDSIILKLCGIASVLWILFITIVSIILSVFHRQTFYNILLLVDECDEKVFQLF